MKQAIEFTKNDQTYLYVGPRRKSNTSYMIVVTKGSALIRLGKQEFLITQGTGFWIPFDCLHALTILPGSQFYKVEISTRVTASEKNEDKFSSLCKEAGFFKVTPLLSSVLVELANSPESKQNWKDPYGRLLRVIGDQAMQLKVSSKFASPHLAKDYHDSLSTLLAGKKVIDSAAQTELAKLLDVTVHEFETCIMLREALKLSRSGRKLPQIAEQLHTSVDTLKALAQPITGESF
ncbi:response regulator transcription factor [Photobacterium lipolyticum]|uniref:AraC-type arabinose-binding/dimerisation domain-containing protein n=1 Tax=Photobacterium lipolyticum TaxID=266810 RepID=A0A2T3MZE3_9GAMM|nr:response regulator transcription factor [Photobacterium lipolyticum]PSW05361.1 hypothetical protein C9I89_08865 [Photobacterium lipolyticum]